MAGSKRRARKRIRRLAQREHPRAEGTFPFVRRRVGEESSFDVQGLHAVSLLTTRLAPRATALLRPKDTSFAVSSLVSLAELSREQIDRALMFDLDDFLGCLALIWQVIARRGRPCPQARWTVVLAKLELRIVQ